MRVLVTGGCGFIGSHVVELLAKKGHEIMIVDDLSTGNMNWIQQVIVKRKKSVNFDMCRIETWAHIEPVIKGFKPEIICHLAAQPAIGKSWEDPLLTATVNEIGTLNLLLCAREHEVKKFIFTSTSAVYAETNDSLWESSRCEPSSPYGVSKLAAEGYVRTIFPNSVVLRLGNVYGPRQVPIGMNQVVPRILRHFLYGDEFSIMGDGRQMRDFVYVEDVANAFLMAMYGTPGIYNIASGVRTSVLEVAHVIEKIYEVEGYQWVHTNDQDPRKEVNLDIADAYNELGWRPTYNLERGLSETAEWWNGRKGK